MQKQGRMVILIVVVLAIIVNVVIASLPSMRGAVVTQYVVLGVSLVSAVVVLVVFRRK